MRSWQAVVGLFLGYFLGKYSSIAIFYLSVLPIVADSLSGGGGFMMRLVTLGILAVTTTIAGGIWLLVNFFALSAWLPKGVLPCGATSALMIAYTVLIVFLAVFNLSAGFLPIPFWVESGWI